MHLGGCHRSHNGVLLQLPVILGVTFVYLFTFNNLSGLTA
jgi:hypothetical protein